MLLVLRPRPFLSCEIDPSAPDSPLWSRHSGTLLPARHQTVVGVGKGKSRKEADGHAADLALTASVTDPVVTAVMRLLRSPAEAPDGAGPTFRSFGSR
jgi:hypothetical protein